MQVPGARARLGGLRLHPSVRVRDGERAEAAARGRGPRDGHGPQRGVRIVEAARAGEEAKQRRVSERGQGRGGAASAMVVVVVDPGLGEEHKGEVRVVERVDGVGEAVDQALGSVICRSISTSKMYFKRLACTTIC